MNIVELPIDFTAANLADIHSKLSELIGAESEYCFDGSQVKSVDGAAIQLLAVCQKSQPSCIDFNVLKPTEILSSALEFLDVCKCSPINANEC